MIDIELDGQKISVPEGSTVMHAADKVGTYIPHFCYHKKLSIAANCRMCLVDVEKAPKPMPACATPVAQGMVVRTKSDKAVNAQKSVMEFLLINHPLDCPICDQGGECQLQDVAVGYGGSASRYREEKRVVLRKDAGPLVSMQEMSRCIHCTRCVRFGQEVAGIMELGMVHRGEHSEITTIVGDTINSELSGNMIDICPVGALTSKPFRYSARTWELSRRKSISPHDSTGANLIVQVKSNRVMRVVPLENEDVNECWLADRDRFSYEALGCEDRLTTPMVKQNGEWHATDWNTALDYVARSLSHIKTEYGPSSIGALGSAHSTVEELHLLAKLVRGMGSENIDFRSRHADFSPTQGAHWLGMPIAALSALQRVLVVGSFLRKDHPLFAQRIRQAARKGAKVHSIHALQDDWLMPMATGITTEPSAWPRALAEVAAAIALANNVAPPVVATVTDAARDIAASLLSGEHKAILLGNACAQHPQASQILALANWIAQQTGAKIGYLTEAANTVGAQLVRAMPGQGGLDAGQMLSGALKACVLLNTEPALDSANPQAAVAALQAAKFVVALSPFKSAALDVADVLLPIAPFSETSGTFVNAQGRVQSFHGVVKPLGETRPAWKVLRVLANLIGLAGFEFETSQEVLQQALGDLNTIVQRLDNRSSAPMAPLPETARTLERIADVPIYATDSLVRRAVSLQLSADAALPMASVSQAVWTRLGLAHGMPVRLAQGACVALLSAQLDVTLADGAVRIPTGHAATANLGAMFGPITVEKA
jgi:NADH-quinone oxidoreductase subunit G